MARIITLAQLAAMPLGTVVSPLVIKDGQMQFNCQGILELGHKIRTVANHHGLYLDVVQLQPDIYVAEGRVTTYQSTSSYAIPGWYPHRFVLWEEH